VRHTHTETQTLFGAVAMAAVMMIAMKGQPGLPHHIVGKLLKKNADQVMMPAMMGHIVFGAVAGLVGILILDQVVASNYIFVGGIVWGLVLMMAAMAQVMMLGLGNLMRDNKRMPVMVGMLHLIYGAVFGALAQWVF